MENPSRLNNGDEGIEAYMVVREVECVGNNVGDAVNIEVVLGVVIKDDFSVMQSQLGCQLD